MPWLCLSREYHQAGNLLLTLLTSQCWRFFIGFTFYNIQWTRNFYRFVAKICQAMLGFQTFWGLLQRRVPTAATSPRPPSGTGQPGWNKIWSSYDLLGKNLVLLQQITGDDRWITASMEEKYGKISFIDLAHPLYLGWPGCWEQPCLNGKNSDLICCRDIWTRYHTTEMFAN